MGSALPRDEFLILGAAVHPMAGTTEGTTEYRYRHGQESGAPIARDT